MSTCSKTSSLAVYADAFTAQKRIRAITTTLARMPDPFQHHIVLEETGD